MVDSEYSEENYKKSTKNPQMLWFISDHLTTKKICKHAVKKLPFVIRYVPDWYKTQENCEKAILESGGALKFVPNS